MALVGALVTPSTEITAGNVFRTIFNFRQILFRNFFKRRQRL